MKKLIQVIGFVLLASSASAQISVPTQASGGGSGTTTLTAGTTATSGCTDGGFLYSLTNLLRCGANAINDGNTITFGNGISGTSVAVVINNASSTGNILNLQSAGSNLITFDDPGTMNFVNTSGCSNPSMSLADADTGVTSTLAGYVVLCSNGDQVSYTEPTTLRTVYKGAISPESSGAVDVGTSAIPWRNGFYSSYIVQAGILGELYETSGATAITITTAGTYYPWASTTAGLSSNMTVSAATDDITATIAGKYRVGVACSVTATANAVLSLRVFLEGVGQTKCTADRKISSGGDVGAADISCLLQMAANDSLTLQFTSDGNGDTVTPTDCNMNASYIGN